ncbi:MAG: CASTOR/POLLUX-related putative ion channel [Microbacteriaceae bacterium]
MTNSFENRTSYGQGAQGEPVAAEAPKFGLLTKLRYNFDNSLSRSGSFVAYVFVTVIVLSALVALFREFIFATPLAAAPEANTLFEKWWKEFTGILGQGGGATWSDRVISVLYWVITTAVTATIIGFVTSAITRTVARLKTGKSPVIDSNHILILGWSNRIFPILKELAVANANVRKPLVVIFADKDRDVMDDEISTRAGDLGKLRVITRKGDVTNPGDLARANVAGARSVIILDADESGDANIVSTVLAVKSVNSNPQLKIVAEVDDANTAEALTSATNGQVQTVRSHDVIARVTAQASRQPGLATVILDLIDFAGDEIYFSRIPALDGQTYGDALLAFNTASVIGFIDADGNTRLNPKASTKIPAGARIIAIAEDDDKVVFTGTRTDITARKRTAAAAKVERTPEHLLVIGWSSMGRSVVSELASFLPKGSTVHIVATPKYVDAAELASLKFGGIKVTHSATTGDIDELIAAAEAKHYDEVIILGYRNAISETEADAQTMLTMLQMNQLFADSRNKVHPTRLVAEILDSRKAELARVAAVDDLVISDNLAALLVAQISENPALAPVFDDLFDAAGAAVNMRPIEHYVPLKKTVSYVELVAAARAAGDSAIGYRVAADAQASASAGVWLNPDKNTEFTTAAGDTLIVIGNVE